MSNVDGFDLTADELHYFQSGGDVNENLAREAPTQPEPAPQPEAPVQQQVQPQEPDDDEPVTERGQPKRIKFSKYEEAENARRDLERQLNERNVNQARLEERLSLLQQALQPQQETQQPQEEQEPDPNQDIFAWIKWQRDRTNRIEQTINDYRQQIELGQSEMREQHRYIESMNEYAAQEPQFVQAYNYLLRNRAAELMAPYYPQATYDQLMGARIPPQIAEQLKQEERDLYKNAFERRLDPAAEVFRMAMVRGFRPQQPQQDPPPSASPPAAQRPGTPMNQTPARAQAPQQTQQPATATALVDAIRRGQPAAQSLSHVSGSAPDIATELTPERLSNMSEEDFARVFNALQERGDNTKLRELFGN